MRRLNMHTRRPFFFFSLGFGDRGGNFLSFFCSQCVLTVFQSSLQIVPNVFPNMFPIAPHFLSHILWPKLNFLVYKLQSCTKSKHLCACICPMFYTIVDGLIKVAPSTKEKKLWVITKRELQCLCIPSLSTLCTSLYSIS
jgi:hypothetical protein